MNRVIKKLFTKVVQSIVGIVVTLTLVLGGINYGIVTYAAEAATEDTSVTNKASFSTDVIYQIVTDRFFDGDSSNNPTGDIFDKSNLQKYHGGDWAGITQKIEDGYLTNMGITAIWISSPVENITTIDPSNNCSAYHGYWARDFFRTNEYFGSFDDFATLIETAHNNDIKVVIDFVPNHTSTAEYGSMVFPEDGALYRDGTKIAGFTNDTLGIFNHESWTDFSTLEDGIYHSLYGLADLNQQNSTVDGYLKDAIDLWLELGVDGIRVDAVKHMSAGWQKSWLSGIYSKEGVFTFGEWFYGGTTNDVEMTTFANENGMSLLDFRFANGVRNALGSNSGSMIDLNEVIIATSTDYKEVNDQVTFIDNHDMSRFMTLASNSQRAVENAYVLLLTSRGVPTIYYGTEQYLQGSTDPYNRGDMTSFSTTSTAYNVISKLAPLRKSNPALAYGTTVVRWINDDVYIYERQFGANVVLTAVNRNQNSSYNITGLLTNLSEGTYSDVLSGLLGGSSINVSGSGSVTTFTLGAGASAVWQYAADSAKEPLIGNVDPMIGQAGNIITITGTGFGSASGTVMFGTTSATINTWNDSKITVTVPSITAGSYNIKVVTAQNVSTSTYDDFKLLTGSQVSVRFKVDNATTDYGTNVYLIGSVYELGNWNTAKAIGPLFNNTSTIGIYPTWFYDVSVPAGTTIEYKFIKIDGSGNVIWESGSNHTVTTPSTGTATVTVGWQ